MKSSLKFVWAAALLVGLTAARPALAQPVVSVTSPTNGASYNPSQTITLSVNATDAATNLASVSFYIDTSLVYTFTSAAYTIGGVSTYILPIPKGEIPAGPYTFHAVAVDAAGNSTTSASVNLTVAYVPPTVSVTNPVAGNSYSAPANLPLLASAASADSTVTSVAFYQGATLLGTVTNAPFALTWSNVFAGSYSLSAVANDARALYATSSVVVVTVTNAYGQPVVDLTAPASNASFLPGANLSLSATALEVNGASITNVEFFANATDLGGAASAPYSLTWSNVAAGNYALTAVAADAAGRSTTSPAASISVFVPHVAPSVSLTSPALGAVLNVASGLNLSATAASTDGIVTNVAFYMNNFLVANVTAAPYSFLWTNPPSGNYALTAVATDDSGAATVSAAVNLVATNSIALATLQQIKTLFIIPLENHDLVQATPTGSPQQLLGNPACPYFNSLITPGNSNAVQVAYAAHMFSSAINGEHPSEPNYIWSEAGTDFGVRTDNDPGNGNTYTNVQHLSAQLTAAGVSWRTYQEDLEYSSSEEVSATGSGGPVNPYNGTTEYSYAVKHNPMAFFTDTQNKNCYPFTNFWTDLASNNLARYNWITPDQFNEMHSSLPAGYTYYGVTYTGDQAAIAEGDNFLSMVIPKIMASQAYQNNGAIIIWTDETESTDDTNTTLPYVIISPLAKGNAYASPLPYSHSSDLKTMDEIFGLAYQTNAIPAGYLDAQITGTNYVDGRSAAIYDLSDFFLPVGAAPVLALTQSGAALTNGATALALGSVNVGATASATFTITNSGNATLVLSNLALSGVNAGDFSVSGLTLPVTLFASQGATFTVTFAPSLAGAETATLSITNNAAGSSPFALVLNGVGVHVPPTVTLASPVSGATFAAPANLVLTATAADTDGTITNVAFYQGSNLLANVASAPFTFTTANLFAGSYALTTVATDNSGATATSSVVNVTITNTPALSVLQSIKTVFVIAMENHDLVQKNPTGSPQQILGNPAAPYFNSLITPGNPNAAQTAWATHMFSCAINGEHPSEPNYIWQEAGTDFGIRTDNDPSAAAHNVFTNVMHLSGQLNAAGIPWRSYQEDVQYSSSEEASASGSGVPVNPYNGTTQYNYGVKHNPMAFFPDTQNQNCYPMTNFWTDLANTNIGRYNWITPDQYNEWHSALSGGYNYFGTNYTGDQAAIASGDNCLSIIIPKIMASAAYKDHGVIIIWTDETESTDDTNTTLPYVIISPLAKGNAYASTLAYSHSSDLKTMDEIFGLAYQTNAIPAAYYDAQNDGKYDYVDGHSATINDLSDFFKGVGSDAPALTVSQFGQTLTNGASAASFGSVSYYSDATATFAVTNSGNAVLVLSNILIAGADAGDFSAANPGWPVSVEPGQGVAFNVTFSPLAIGTRVATLQITDNDTNNNPFSLSLTAIGMDEPPTVVLTAPANGGKFAAPARLTLSAGASDIYGAITNVAFYQGSNLLANVTSAPYTFTTANIFAGSYTLTAVATDDSGACNTSSVVNVTITNTPALSVLQSIKTVFVIAMENHDLVQKNPTGSPQQILGNPAAPYFNSLITPGNPNAAQTAWATHMFSCAINGEHPSEPNYIWQEAGTDFGIRTDNDPSFASHNLFTNVMHLSGQLTAAGIPWRTYQEDVQYSSSEEASTSGSGVPVNPYNGTTQYNYGVKHNPMAFFADTQNQNCYPMTNFWTDLANTNIGRYNWITPDQYNEWHSALSGGYNYFGTNYTGDQAAIASGDNALSIIIPRIMASAAYQDHGVIIIWTDETESTDDTNTTLPYIIISPLAKGNAYASTLAYNHSSDLKTMDEIFGLAYQTNAIPAAYYDAQNDGKYDYVDGHSAAINDLSDFFKGVGSDAPALTVSQSGQTLTNGASAASFGSVSYYSDATATFAVTNTGSAVLVLSNILIAGTDAVDFSVANLGYPVSIDPGQGVAVNVTFSPLAIGARVATLQISDNDTNNNPFSLSLAGQGMDEPPTVVLTAPANGTSFAAPARLTVSAGAADIYGLITNVAFYQGSNLLANITSAPYTCSTPWLYAGSYAFTAVATDDSGACNTSSVATVAITNSPAVSVLQSIKTIFVIAMENHDLVQKNPTGSPQQILGNPAAPYFNSLITPGNSNSVQTAYATHMFSSAINGEHPSEPNYVWQEAGTDFGVRTDSDPSTSAGNVFTNVMHLSAQLSAAGIPWRSYQEDLEYTSSEEVSANGSGKPVNPYNGTTDYNYAVKHNPMAFFPDTQNQNCYPLTNFWTDLTNHNIGRYNWITPDQYNEWHSSLPGGYTNNGVAYTGDQAAIAEGDHCLSIIIPKIMASAAYQDHGVIIIWTDETESTDDTNTTLPYVIISPLAKGNAYASALPYSHSSDLKTMDEIFQLAYQTNAIPTAYNGAAYLDAQNTGTNYVDGRSAAIYDLSDFFQGVGISITNQPVSVTTNAGAAASFKVGATAAAAQLSYQWYLGTNLLSGQTSNTLSLAAVGQTNVGSYYVVVSSASGSANSAPATLTVVYQAPNVVGGKMLLGANGFQLGFTGPSAQTYTVLATDDLTVPQSAWTVLTTGTFNGSSVTFTDPDAVNHPHRYYVIKSP